MMIEPEIKYLIEDYVDMAARFQDILAFYQSSNAETRKYFSERFENLTKKKFEEVFAPLLKTPSPKRMQKKQKKQHR